MKYVKVKYVKVKYVKGNCSLGMGIMLLPQTKPWLVNFGEFEETGEISTVTPKPYIILARIQAKPTVETLHHILSCVPFPSQAQVLQKRYSTRDLDTGYLSLYNCGIIIIFSF